MSTRVLYVAVSSLWAGFIFSCILNTPTAPATGIRWIDGSCVSLRASEVTVHHWTGIQAASHVTPSQEGGAQMGSCCLLLLTFTYPLRSSTVQDTGLFT